MRNRNEGNPTAGLPYFYITDSENSIGFLQN